jgi:arylsulfatase A-like enzyme
VRAENAPPFKAKAEHVLLCVWDGMRPDFITPENTPNLHALAARGTFFNNNHSFYITTTEVNGAVLATGVFPRRSGIMANLEYRPAIDLMHGVATDDFTTVLTSDALTDGRHLAVPTVAELVQKAGRTTAVVCTKMIGLLHDRGKDRTGRSPTLWLGRTYPKDFLKTIVQAQGKFPAYPKTDIFDIADARPNTAQNLWTTKALVNVLWKDEIPAYSVLWLGDPDFSQHFTAPGSPTALAAIHDSDTHLGIALAALEKRGKLDSTDVFVVSDHGFSTIGHAVNLVDFFARRGLKTYREFKTTPRPGDILLASVGGSTSIYVIGSDPKIIARLVEALQTSGIAGPIFTRDGLPGTFTFRDARIDTETPPDIVFSFRWGDLKNQYGAPGLIVGEAKRPGGGTHGTLSRYDIHNTLVAAGPDIRVGFRDELPTGNIDVAPTTLAILGLAQPGGCDGRVLYEALNGVDYDAPKPETKRMEAMRRFPGGTWTQFIQTTTFGDKIYFDEGNAVNSK